MRLERRDFQATLLHYLKFDLMGVILVEKKLLMAVLLLALQHLSSSKIYADE